MTTVKTTTLESALHYAALDWAVFPITAGRKKPPLTPTGFKNATTDPDQIREWWGTWPDANIGIATGDSGLVVIDIDPDHGGDITALPLTDSDRQTATTRTGGGGHHLIYRAPQGLTITNSNKKLPEGIDVRGMGGYIIAPPSLHPSGTVYKWERDPVIILPLPAALIPMLQVRELEARPAPRPAITPPAEVGGDHPYVQAALNNELDKLARSTDGNRNNALNDAAFALGQFVEAGLLDRTEAETLLERTGLAIGLGENETRKTIASGIAAGMAKPRQWPELSKPRVLGDGHIEDEPPPNVDFLLGESADDEGNAQCLNRLYPNKFLHCEALGWLFYNGRHWQREAAEARLDRAIVRTLKRRRLVAVQSEAEHIVKAAKPSANNVRNCKSLFRSLVTAGIDSFDNAPDHLNCSNGIVDLRTGELSPHSPDHRFTYAIPAPYDPGADITKWTTWLQNALRPEGANGIAANYTELMDWLQMAVGYSLTGQTNEQCMFYIYGPARGGKGIFLQTLGKLLGAPLYSAVDFDTFTAKRGQDNQNFDLAPLKAARFVAASESERANLLNSKIVKGVTGNDPIHCAFKRKDFFTYTPKYKIWLASNFKIMGDANDDALWSRLRVINFPNSYLGREDFTLGQRLQRNPDGVLAWAVAGSVRWYERLGENIGLGQPEIIARVTQDHRQENDTVAQFIEECSYTDLGNSEVYTIGREFTRAYNDWCHENGFTPFGGRRLGEVMRTKGFLYKAKLHSGKTVKTWLGIGLIT